MKKKREKWTQGSSNNTNSNVSESHRTCRHLNLQNYFKVHCLKLERQNRENVLKKITHKTCILKIVLRIRWEKYMWMPFENHHAIKQQFLNVVRCGAPESHSALRTSQWILMYWIALEEYFNGRRYNIVMQNEITTISICKYTHSQTKLLNSAQLFLDDFFRY